ncbi:MAG: agmatinase [Candidatus Nanopelagicales bacterium]
MGKLQYGPDFTFLGVPKCDISDTNSMSGAQVVIIGAPFDGGTSFRSGAKFGPSAVRQACYLEHDGKRPSLALRIDGLTSLQVRDAGDVEMPSGNTEVACSRLENVVATVAKTAMPLIIGGDHTVTWPNVTGIAKAKGWGKIAVLHFDAHADTGEIKEGALIGHGQPMRKLIESGAVRGDRFFQIGLRGYWPDEPILSWMAAQGMRSYEMTEITHRGLNECLSEIFAAVATDCDGVFLSVDIDVADPAAAPGTGTPEPGGLSARELLDAVRRICLETNVVGMDVVEVAPAYDHAEITALLANRVILEALSAIARKQSGSKFDPTKPLLSDR